MRHTPPKEIMANVAAIIEYCVCNPNVPTTYIADRFGVHIVTVSRAMDKYFSCVFGEMIVLESDINSDRAKDQEIMYNKIYNGQPVHV